MVKIRLQRAGAKNHPFYRVVAIDERRQRDGRALEFLGTYDPFPTPPKIQLRTERIDAWKGKGAQISGAVASLVRRSKKLTPVAAAVEKA